MSEEATVEASEAEAQPEAEAQEEPEAKPENAETESGEQELFTQVLHALSGSDGDNDKMRDWLKSRFRYTLDGQLELIPEESEPVKEQKQGFFKPPQSPNTIPNPKPSEPTSAAEAIQAIENWVNA